MPTSLFLFLSPTLAINTTRWLSRLYLIHLSCAAGWMRSQLRSVLRQERPVAWSDPHIPKYHLSKRVYIKDTSARTPRLKKKHSCFLLFCISSMWSSRCGCSQQAFYNSEAAALLCNRTRFWWLWLFFERCCSLVSKLEKFTTEMEWDAPWFWDVFVVFFSHYTGLGCWHPSSCWFFFVVSFSPV